MAGIRALQRRIKRIEEAEISRPSLIVMFYGSFDLFVELTVLPGIESGALSRPDMIDVVAALRTWENDGTWDRA
jgi:hypothetical protein